eukprot:g2026.t1
MEGGYSDAQSFAKPSGRRRVRGRPVTTSGISVKKARQETGTKISIRGNLQALAGGITGDARKWRRGYEILLNLDGSFAPQNAWPESADVARRLDAIALDLAVRGEPDVATAVTLLSDKASLSRSLYEVDNVVRLLLALKGDAPREPLGDIALSSLTKLQSKKVAGESFFTRLPLDHFFTKQCIKAPDQAVHNVSPKVDPSDEDPPVMAPVIMRCGGNQLYATSHRQTMAFNHTLFEDITGISIDAEVEAETARKHASFATNVPASAEEMHRSESSKSNLFGALAHRTLSTDAEDFKSLNFSLNLPALGRQAPDLLEMMQGAVRELNQPSSGETANVEDEHPASQRGIADGSDLHASDDKECHVEDPWCAASTLRAAERNDSLPPQVDWADLPYSSADAKCGWLSEESSETYCKVLDAISIHSGHVRDLSQLLEHSKNALLGVPSSTFSLSRSGSALSPVTGKGRSGCISDGAVASALATFAKAGSAALQLRQLAAYLRESNKGDQVQLHFASALEWFLHEHDGRVVRSSDKAEEGSILARISASAPLRARVERLMGISAAARTKKGQDLLAHLFYETLAEDTLSSTFSKRSDMADTLLQIFQRAIFPWLSFIHAWLFHGEIELNRAEREAVASFADFPGSSLLDVPFFPNENVRSVSRAACALQMLRTVSAHRERAMPFYEICCDMAQGKLRAASTVDSVRIITERHEERYRRQLARLAEKSTQKRKDEEKADRDRALKRRVRLALKAEQNARDEERALREQLEMRKQLALAKRQEEIDQRARRKAEKKEAEKDRVAAEELALVTSPQALLQGEGGYDPDPALQEDAKNLLQEEYSRLIDDAKSRQILARWRADRLQSLEESRAKLRELLQSGVETSSQHGAHKSDTLTAATGTRASVVISQPPGDDNSSA